MLNPTHRGEAGHKNAAKIPAQHTNQHQDTLLLQVGDSYRFQNRLNSAREERASKAEAEAEACGVDGDPTSHTTARQKTLQDNSVQFLAGAETVEVRNLLSLQYPKSKSRCADFCASTVHRVWHATVQAWGARCNTTHRRLSNGLA